MAVAVADAVAVAVAVAVADAVAVAVAEAVAVAVAVADAVPVAVAEAVPVAVAEEVPVAVELEEAVDVELEVPVALDDPDDVDELVLELLLEADVAGLKVLAELIEFEIEGDEEELTDCKLEGLSDCFCAAEGELDCDTDWD